MKNFFTELSNLPGFELIKKDILNGYTVKEALLINDKRMHEAFNKDLAQDYVFENLLFNY